MNSPSRRRPQRIRRLSVPPAASQFRATDGADSNPAHLGLLIDATGHIQAVQEDGAAGLLHCPVKLLLGSPVTHWLRRIPSPAATIHSPGDKPFSEQPSGESALPLVNELFAAAAAVPPAQPLACAWLCDPAHGAAPLPVTVRAGRVQSATGPCCLLHICLRPGGFPGSLSHGDARLATILDSIADAVITTDAHGNVTYLNAAAEILIGCPSADAAGFPVEEIYRRAGAQPRRQIDNPVRAVLQTGLRVNPRDTAYLSGDPTAGNLPRVIADNAAPITDSGPDGRLLGVVLVFHDITDRHRATEELQKAGRIESLGLLAGGIAHDFNNLLTSVLGNLSVARSSGGSRPFFTEPGAAQEWAHQHPPLPPAVIEAIDRAERACSRARELTNQLLTFAKGGDPVRKTIELPVTIEQAVHFALTGSNVLVDCHFDPNLAHVEADEGQLVQVFHNLALNAAQAMGETGGTLEIRAVNLRGFPGSVAPPLPPGDFVVVTVRDTGCGIPSEHMAKIFDPFFTTRASGTGLGLATAYSIIKKHEGGVKVESEPGLGTTFTVYLPARLAAGTESGLQDASDGPAVRPASGLRILFMDDDADIRELIGAILALLGYEVTLTSDGAAAIVEYEKALAAGEKFAAVILDLTIPGGMGGKETVRRLLELDPAVRAIVSSGYSNDAVVSDFKGAGFVGMVAKPYKMEDLARVLIEVIEAPQAGGSPARSAAQNRTV